MYAEVRESLVDDEDPFTPITRYLFTRRAPLCRPARARKFTIHCGYLAWTGGNVLLQLVVGYETYSTLQAWRKEQKNVVTLMAIATGRRHRCGYGGEQGMTSRRLRAPLGSGIPFGA